ncbi:hypothetical protein NEOKW01_1488 [Nematocida sp. AWRm80]|nr:hypothetical protein NEOKW01_1488 [Nematocida sp. AWRm80]
MNRKNTGNRKRLSVINAEISLLEREKEMSSNSMVEIDNEENIKKRVKITRGARQASETESNKDAKCATETKEEIIDQERIKNINQLFFEIYNLPLEYILAQSSKMVLTEEWQVSILERVYVEKMKEVVKLVEARVFLKERPKGIFQEANKKRKEILTDLKEKKQALKVLGDKLMRKSEGVSLLDRVNTATAQDKPNKNLQDTYKRLLSLFSLMKSNKSTVRVTIPQTKKTTSTMHSSHTTCLEKIKNEIGKITTISELARYRQGKKIITEKEKHGSISLHKTNKHSIPIIYTDKHTPLASTPAQSISRHLSSQESVPVKARETNYPLEDSQTRSILTDKEQREDGLVFANTPMESVFLPNNTPSSTSTYGQPETGHSSFKSISHAYSTGSIQGKYTNNSIYSPKNTHQDSSSSQNTTPKTKPQKNINSSS